LGVSRRRELVRRVLAALLSVIVVGLMLAMPVSAGAKTVTFTDRQGDLGTAFFSAGQGSHEWGDPLGWWSGESPIGKAGYLDMLSGWVSVRGDTVTMGLMVASPVPTDGELPESVVEVMWGWFFYQSIDVYYGGGGAPYAVYIVWDGVDFNAVLVDRTSGTLPFDLTYLDFAIEGNVLTVPVSSASIAGAIAWFSETIASHGNPYPLDGVPQFGGWMAPDLTDYQGPLAIYWPWQAMP
jgi:hypothetical protein